MTDDNEYYEPSSSRQVGGEHYTTMKIQPWDVMKAWMSPDGFRGFLCGNILKYVARFDRKGGAEDLRKALHYLEKLIEEVEGGSA